MDFPSTKWVREQSDSTGPQESSPAAPSAAAATFERQLSEIGSSGEGGAAMPAAAAPQPAQSTGILRGRRRPLYSEDAALIWGLEKALIKGGATEYTAEAYVRTLRSFGRWLFATNKDPIAARLDDESLTDDAREFGKERPGRILAVLYHLRTFQSTDGIVRVGGRTELNPHPQDADLINEYQNEVATDTDTRYATALRSFSDYLRDNNRPGIAGRLGGTLLDEDVESYKKDVGGHLSIGAALARLRKSLAGAEAMELERHIDPEDAALRESRRVGDAAARRSLQEVGSWPEELLPAEGHEQDLLLGLMDEPGASSSALQSGVLMGRSKQPLYSEDAVLISGLEKALIEGGATKDTAKAYEGSLRSFSRWLFANNKGPIVARLNDESLTDDARELFEKGNPAALLKAIDHLRTFQSTGGIVPIAGHPELNPHPQDTDLINEYQNEVATDTDKRYATALRSFSDYLRENNRPGIAGRLGGTLLDGDVESYKKDVGGARNIRAALARLRKSQAGAEAMELERHIDPEDAALRESVQADDAAAQHSASQKAGRWPDELLPAEGHDQDLLSGLMDEPGASSSALQSAPGILRGRRRRPLYSEDAALISGLEKALIKGGAAEDTAKGNGRTLLSFGQWLLANNKDPIVARLNDKSLTDDAREFGKGNPAALLKAIDHLRISRSTGGIVPIAGRIEVRPYPQDAALIKEYQNEVAADTGKRDATALRSFSDYLRDNNRPGIAGRLGGTLLDEDVESYRKITGTGSRIGPALARLRKSQAGAEAMERARYISPGPDPEDAALRESMQVGDAAAQHSASQKAGSWPEELLPAEGQEQDLLLGLMDEPGASSSALPSGVLMGRSKQPLYSEDARVISAGVKEALIDRNVTERVAAAYEGSLLSFGRWLFANNKDPIAARLNDKSLTDDAREFGKGHPARLLAALYHLRTFQLTDGVTAARRAELNPYPQDVALINEYKNEAATGSGKRHATALRSFSDYLRENNRPGIAARLSDNTLDKDVERYRKVAGGDVTIGTALAHLRKSQAGAKAMERARYISPGPDPEDAALRESGRVGEAAAQHSSQEVGSWPEELLPAEGHERDLLLGLIDDPGLSSSLEPVARHDQASDPGESIRPLNWRHDRQQFPDESMAALARSNLPPSEEVLINDEQDTAELRPAKRLRTLDNPQGLAERQLSEIAATPAPTHQQGASPWQAQPMMQASGHEDATAPHAAATYVGGAAAQHSAPQGAVSRPFVLPEGYDQDLRLMVEEAPPWSGGPPEQAHDIVQAGQQEPARFASTWLPQMPLNFDWSMWPTLEAAPALAARARSDTYGGLEAAVNPNSPASFELRDNAWSPAPDFPPLFAGPVPGHHQGARQFSSPQGLSPVPASSDDDALAWLSEELARQMQEPAASSTARAQDLYRGFEALLDPDPAELDDNAHFEPAPSARAPSDIYGGLASFVDLDPPTPSELRDDAHFAPAPSARIRSDIYRGFPVVDLTAPAPSPLRDDVRPFPSTSADAQIGALDPTASSHNRGLVLEDTEWLGDEHIDRDYRLQEQDLQRYHPNLAARTRFVNPLIVLNYLRSNHDGVVLTEFQRIVYDGNGNDTADFLFLPVINADPEDPNRLGNHWSLLFVDRRDRGRPVAYHYDSFGGLNNRDAEHLAGRLDLRLEPAVMARQRNSYDCGVFVVDGTRALVRQLEQGREPDLLNLSNLVANRQALQNRLRG
ncbi:Ulp1 family isopeptidase [Bradyrhizobium sp. ma5]|uniref:Ulp1 family isopeptidase n=1 Tax=Bradyrhizobium sp. ma5 TaxID=3344828 RepID=UPI0035D49A80